MPSHRYKKIPLLLLCLLSFCFSGCQSREQTRTTRLAQTENQETPERPWTIIDFRDRGRDISIPPWIDAFLEGKEPMVEALDEFQNRFVFVAVNSGNNFTALSQWQDGFSPEMDFARLAAIRIENRFLLALAGYPDDEYGAYYESLIRAASNFIWEGAAREDDYWIQKRYAEPGLDEGDVFPAIPLPSEIYDFFVLVTVEKSDLARQINELLTSVNPVPPLNRYQNSAVSRVKERFFEGF